MNEDDIFDKTVATINESTGSPFLFIGSGFSRRYLDLPKWDELLKLFCEDDGEFQKLMATSSEHLPSVAKDLAEIYHHRWWNSESFKDKRANYQNSPNKVKFKNKTSALRWEICDYLRKTIEDKKFNLEEEIESLGKINIDGIITTNWDNLIERIFPEHQVYIGQSDLLFSDTHSVGEIYKIHGCASLIDSLILTSDDYESFNQLNPYLAAKLITIFVEHPVIFIGYSMNDENIISLLSSIVNVLDQQKLEKLSKNLIFVQRADGGPTAFNNYTLQFGNRSIPAKQIKTDNFKIVYEAIAKFEKKIPVRLIRLYKQQFYEIVSSSLPSKRMHVVNESSIDANSKIQVVVGLSVATDAASKIGYTGISLQDLFEDFLQDKNYQSDLIITNTLPKLPASAKYVPIFKYLKKSNIKSKIDLQKSNFQIPAIKKPINGAEFYQTETYRKRFNNEAKKLSIETIISSFNPSTAAYFLPFLSKSKFKTDVARSFININKDLLISKDNKSTPFRKLACYLDWFENGFPL